MTRPSALRIAVALLFTAALVLVALQRDSYGYGAVIVAACGLLTVAVFLLFTERESVRTTTQTGAGDDMDLGVIKAIAEPVLMLLDNRVRAANPSATALLGEHIIGEDIRLAIRHPASSARFAPGAPDGSVELAGIGTADQRVEMYVTTIAPGKRIVHLVDRAERHAVDQARTDFVANASHELRTPLSAILGFVETLADEKTGDDREVRTRFLGIMLKEAQRMQRLIDDLISLSRIEAEKHLLPDEIISLPALVSEVADELGNAASRIELDVHSGDVVGDRAQLSQLTHNLLGNAIKYGRAGSPVRISVRADGTWVRLTVTDQGEGIASEHLPRLTERFYRVDAGRSRTVGGTGLGLAIVKHIVERHRGRLEITSKIGVGTTAAAIFPTAPVAAVTETSLN